MSASGIRAGRAYVELGLLSDKLTAGLNAAKSRLQAWGASLAKLGIASAIADSLKLAPAIAAGKLAASTGASLEAMAARTGVAASELSRLQYVAEQSHTSLEALAGGMDSLGQLTVKFHQGSQDAAIGLRALGVSVEQWDHMTKPEKLSRVADVMTRIGNIETRKALAEKLGLSDELLPLLSKGSAGIKAMKAEADKLGLTIPEADIQAAATMQRQFGAIYASIRRVTIAFGGALAPVLQEAVGWLSAVSKPIVNILTANRGVISSIIQLAAYSAAGGLAVAALGKGISLAGTAIGLLIPVIQAATALIGFMVSPIGLVVVAVGAAVAAFLRWTETGQAFVAWLSGSLGDLVEDTQGAVKAMGAALARGDVATAAKVLWSLLRLEWTKGVAFLVNIWNGITVPILNAWGRISNALAHAWFNTSQVFESTWAETTAWLETLWIDMSQGIVQAMRAVAAIVIKLLLRIFTEYTSFLINVAAKTLALVPGLEAVAEKIRDIATNWKAAGDAAQQGVEDWRRAGRTEESRKKADARDAERQKQRDRIDADAAAARNALDQQLAEEERRRKEAAAKAEADAQAEIDKARSEFEKMKAEAFGPKNPRKKPDEADRETKKRDGKGNTAATLNALGLMQQRESIVGTFNGRFAAQLGGSTAAERTAAATEETARHTAILDRLVNALFAGA